MDQSRDLRSQPRNGASEPSWTIGLADFHEFQPPVSQGELHEVEPQLRAIRDATVASHGSPVYFPFAFSDLRPMRAAQGYLAKLPAAATLVIPGFSDAVDDADRTTTTEATSGGRTSPWRSGFMTDTVLRKALERHAVDWTLGHFASLDFEVEDVGSTRPYDIVAKQGDVEVHIEVKGSSGSALTVELTDGEVQHALTYDNSVLVVMDQIRWRIVDGEVTTSGGSPRIWRDWSPALEALTPTRYRYLLLAD